MHDFVEFILIRTFEVINYTTHETNNFQLNEKGKSSNENTGKTMKHDSFDYHPKKQEDKNRKKIDMDVNKLNSSRNQGIQFLVFIDKAIKISIEYLKIESS